MLLKRRRHLFFLLTMERISDKMRQRKALTRQKVVKIRLETELNSRTTRFFYHFYGIDTIRFSTEKTYGGEPRLSNDILDDKGKD